MKPSTGLAVVAVVLFSSWPLGLSAQIAVENPRWLHVRDFMSVVAEEAGTREVALESGLMPEFARLSSEQQSLMSIARTLDEDLRGHAVRREDLNAESIAIETVWQGALARAEVEKLERENWLIAERDRIRNAAAEGLDVTVWAENWEQRNAEYKRRFSTTSTPRDPRTLPEWADEYAPGVRARWQRFHDDNSRLAAETAGWLRRAAVYDPKVDEWLIRLDAMASRLRAEADRISSILPPGSATRVPVTPPVPRTAGTEPPLRTIDPAVSPPRALATASVELARALEEPFQEYAVRLANHGVWVGHLLKGVPTPPVVSVALTGSLVVDSLLDMGIRSEADRQQAEEERLRRSLPNIMRESPIIQEMDRLNRELEPLVLAGTWTRQQKRDLMTSRARAMVEEANLGEQDFRVRALNAFFTADAAYEALKIVASNTMAYRIGSALGSVEGGRPADVRVAEFVGWTTGNITSDILDAARKIQDDRDGR